VIRMPSERASPRWNSKGSRVFRWRPTPRNINSAGTSKVAVVNAPVTPLATPKRWKRMLRRARLSGVISRPLAGGQSLFGGYRDAIEFHPVIDEPKAEAGGDSGLKFFELGVMKFDDITGFDIDQMIVMFILHGFIA
jgi:hypothetical protein